MVALLALVTGCVTDISADLGFPDESGVVPRFINDRGDIAFEVMNQGWVRSYRWSAETRSSIPLEALDRPLTQVQALGADGTVAGVAWGSSVDGGSFHPVVWDPHGQGTEIGLDVIDGRLPRVAEVDGMSDDGRVYVTVEYTLLDLVRVFVVWDPLTRASTVVDLGPGAQVNGVSGTGVLVGTDAAGPVRWVPTRTGYRVERLSGGIPEAINRRGDIVGWEAESYPPGGSIPNPRQPLIWPAGSDAALVLTAPEPYPYGVLYRGAIALNDSGSVVATMGGWEDYSSLTNAYRWDDAPSRPHVSPRKLELAGPGTRRFAAVGSINAAGTAVGVTNENLDVLPVRWT